MTRLFRGANKSKVLLGILALALDFSFGAIPASADSVTLTGVGGANQGGVYVAPYFLSINGQPDVAAICDDFDHSVFITESWMANISGYSNLSLTRWGTAKTHEYKEAAWLFNKFFENPAQAGDINFAVWALFTPSAKLSSGYTSGAANWLNLAGAQSFAGFDFSGYQVITPKDLSDCGPQEYIIKHQVPEPANLVLVMIGLTTLMVFALTRRAPIGIVNASSNIN